MTAAGSTDSPATLYGPVSLALGVVALLTAVFVGVIGPAVPLLAGSLAATFGGFGLSRAQRRTLPALGLALGGASFLYVFFLLMTFA
ncbi:hypothetical protein [Streptomyces alkaliterrae]|uniref:Uncharacterized protein n=1 Tax=Streptomyces alkaliterrae TaxID=2213162 RepID=A0A5P0YW08_9ACTN|nr:hypothetical protein [Streptomyces alkaliterrae]MBB1254740.1 hypothetical protein [Streptomyces alkaliterrae]MBB1260605.1 hypothetical protein [Streptomyces alkaliterrae]MQS03662.1 hypothetical protein [Streptomyces alkaliterrae]